MVTPIFVVGVLGNILSGLVYISPTKTFWRVVKNRSTEDFESIPYICTLVNAYFWIYYGTIKPNSLLLATVNGFGAIAEYVYILLFLIFAPPRMRARTAILFGTLDVGFPAAAILLTQFVIQSEQVRINVAGLLCICFSMITYSSPLAAMKTVVETRSVEFMPFYLSLSLFINGGLWTLYALLTRDYFVGVPNGTGFVLGKVQLILYAIYKFGSKRLQRKLGNIEDGSQNESLIQGE